MNLLVPKKLVGSGNKLFIEFDTYVAIRASLLFNVQLYSVHHDQSNLRQGSMYSIHVMMQSVGHIN